MENFLDLVNRMENVLYECLGLILILIVYATIFGCLIGGAFLLSSLLKDFYKNNKKD